MAKRRTGGIQRRSRASQEAMTRRLEAPRSRLPWPIIALIGLVALAVIAVLVALVAGSRPNPNVGVAQPDDGRGHIPSCQPGGYSSVPATSGCHDGSPTSWGVHAVAPPETTVIHNLEHGGIAIWYQADQLTAEQIGELEDYVNTQVQSNRFKVLLAPWEGADFEHPIAVTAWQYLLYQDTVDLGVIRDFVSIHYGNAPEPNGGPGPPAV
jgi:hypothetical protein